MSEGTTATIVMYLWSEMQPTRLPISVSRMSALSGRRWSLNSALLVNILYGSSVPHEVRSSTITPTYLREKDQRMKSIGQL